MMTTRHASLRSLGLERFFFGLFLLATLGMVTGGCREIDAEEETNDAPSFEQAATLGVDSTAVSWMAHYMGDAKIGYGSISVAPFNHNNRNYRFSVSKNYLQIRRFHEITTQEFQYGSIESEEGALLRFQFEYTSGQESTEIEGYVENDQLLLTTHSEGGNRVNPIDWNPEWRGPFAAEQSIQQNPMQPGERRTARGLLPVINQPVNLSLEASDYEMTDLLDRSVELLRIRGIVTLAAGQELETIYWADRDGVIHKVCAPAMNQTSYLTDAETARASGDRGTFDLGQFSLVEIEQGLERPHQAREIVYQVRLENDDPAALFVSEGAQEVESIDEKSATITVQRIQPGEPSELTNPGEPPSSEDREPNSLIQSDDPGVVEFAASIASEEEDPWQLAIALESAVHEGIESKNYSQAFASAAEVVQSREGDCTEHAVLLAAICRARGIPARVAIGLVYYPAEEGFAFHMWNEVWIADRWIPLDATLGQGGIGAGHLKLETTSLAGASAFNAFLPVIQVMAQLEIEVISRE